MGSNIKTWGLGYIHSKQSYNEKLNIAEIG